MRAIICLLVFAFSTFAHAGKQAALELASDAPDRHTVARGDTLWDLAKKFLKDPFRWPELWRMNAEQVKNPHRIYPGQVLILDRSSQPPRLLLGETVKLSPQIRSEPLPDAIPAIPALVIEPFLAEPLAIEPAQLDASPRIVATQENRFVTGLGDLVYAAGIDDGTHAWQVYRPGRPLIDPESQETLGIEAIYLGEARVVGAVGETTPLLIVKARQEIGRGDRLVPLQRSGILSYAPHAPAKPIEGRIIHLYGGVGEGGQYSIVSLSRGARDGLEVGHVLALYRAGALVRNRFEDDKELIHRLPDARYGLVFVFRVFPRVAYALVMEAARPVLPGDRVATP
ncbi:MAG: LysM peptidoglycan-binding domain-containing protein [Rhodocyclaceae bacterium]|nr:LysM peptidoglycan-binding domain-containing protein [Rhodocyclaceae bacterium]